MGARIRELRLERELKQSELAEQVGIAHNTLSDYEVGNRSSIDILAKLAVAFGVSLDYLVGLEDEFGNKIYSTDS